MAEYKERMPEESRLTRKGIQTIILIAFALLFGLFYLFHALKVAPLKELLIFFFFVLAGAGLIFPGMFHVARKAQGHTAVPVQQVSCPSKPQVVSVAVSCVWLLALDIGGICALYNGITRNDPYALAIGIIITFLGGIMTWVIIHIFLRARKVKTTQK